MNAKQVLEALVKQYNRLRKTPVVDDDFPEMLEGTDLLAQRATRWLEEMKGKPLDACSQDDPKDWII